MDAPESLLWVDMNARPGDSDFTAQLEELHWYLLAIRPTRDDVEELTQLWSAIEAIDGSDAAWKGIVSALLQDPWFLTY